MRLDFHPGFLACILQLFLEVKNAKTIATLASKEKKTVSSKKKKDFDTAYCDVVVEEFWLNSTPSKAGGYRQTEKNLILKGKFFSFVLFL